MRPFQRGCLARKVTLIFNLRWKVVDRRFVSVNMLKFLKWKIYGSGLVLDWARSLCRRKSNQSYRWRAICADDMGNQYQTRSLVLINKTKKSKFLFGLSEVTNNWLASCFNYVSPLPEKMKVRGGNWKDDSTLIFAVDEKIVRILRRV